MYIIYLSRYLELFFLEIPHYWSPGLCVGKALRSVQSQYNCDLTDSLNVKASKLKKTLVNLFM